MKQLKDVEKNYNMQETQMDAMIQQKVSKTEEELKKVFEAKSKLLEEETDRFKMKMNEGEAKVKQLQLLLDESQSELLEVKSKQERQNNASSEEVDILLVDLDRANQRAAASERELLLLKDQLQEARSLKNQQSSLDLESQETEQVTRDLKAQLLAKEQEVIQLVGDAQKTNKIIQENEMKHEKITSELSNKNDQLMSELESANNLLVKQNDYESIKKDLSIMKSLYFPSQGSEQDEIDNRPLEVLILERSKTLQNDNSMLRQDKERMFEELTQTKQELSDNRQKLEKQTELINQLEDHIEQLQSISTPYREEAEGRSSSDMLAEALKVESSLIVCY